MASRASTPCARPSVRLPSGLSALVALALAATPLTACGSGPIPPPQNISVDTGTLELRWSPVEGAVRYDLYSRVTTKPSLGATPIEVGPGDTLLENVTSPLSLSGFSQCERFYFVAVAAVDQDGERSVSATIGFGPSATACTR
ncbi:MAG: hypothetical protein IPK13_25140 [Deltaproteobacteria bacterium]|nr:hypothetical protein [Deltaproteobacteria bacterium]